MLENQWKQYLDELFEKKFGRSLVDRQAPTIGVEQEFFLLNEFDQLAGQDESQKIFQGFAKLPGSKIRRDENGLISQVNFQHADTKSYTVLKYEFFPHLLEIAIGYAAETEVLKNRLINFFGEIQKIVATSGLKIPSSSLLPIDSLSDVSIRHLGERATLLHERRKLNLVNVGKSSLLANFPAFTAGTQVQIGGCNWWADEGLMSRLYLTELSHLKKSFMIAIPDKEKSAVLLRERMRRYYDVYSGKNLLGFPKIEHWSWETWSTLLTHDLKMNPLTTTVRELIDNVHDLSLISVKPKIGTIEFRGSPSLFSIDQIIEEIENRYDQFQSARNRSGNPNIYTEYTKWMALLSNETASDNENHPMKKVVLHG